MSIINAVRTYILTYPNLAQFAPVNVDYLSADPTNYTIDGIPTTAIISKDIAGNSVRQFQFVIASREYYGSDTLQNIANSGWYETFSDWLESQTEAGLLPTLGAKQTATRIYATDSGYLFDGDPASGNARYQIQCALEYEQTK